MIVHATMIPKIGTAMSCAEVIRFSIISIRFPQLVFHCDEVPNYVGSNFRKLFHLTFL